jgi:hypothetical protein
MDLAAPQPGTEDAMSICGVITTRDVFLHTATIVREFGTGAFLRCCVAVILRRRTTFLACVVRLPTQ